MIPIVKLEISKELSLYKSLNNCMNILFHVRIVVI